MQNCRRKAPDNNNSVKFTSSRGDNSTTNDSMVMKIAHAQLLMYTKIVYKVQSSTYKTRRKAPYKPFENTVGKGEIDRNEQFLLFPQCFLPV